MQGRRCPATVTGLTTCPEARMPASVKRPSAFACRGGGSRAFSAGSCPPGVARGGRALLLGSMVHPSDHPKRWCDAWLRLWLRSRYRSRSWRLRRAFNATGGDAGFGGQTDRVGDIGPDGRAHGGGQHRATGRFNRGAHGRIDGRANYWPDDRASPADTRGEFAVSLSGHGHRCGWTHGDAGRAAEADRVVSTEQH